MAIPPYQLGYPPDGSSLGQTKTTIRGNLDGTFETLAVDHINNNGQPSRPSGSAGYHNIIRIVQNSTPSAIGAIGQLFNTAVTNAYGTDEILYYLTGGNQLQQLTLNITPNQAINGYTFLPGGFLLNFGLAMNIASGTVISLNKSCLTACVNVQATPLQVSNSRTFVYTDTYNPGNFKVTISDANGGATVGSFSWMAIGY